MSESPGNPPEADDTVETPPTPPGLGPSGRRLFETVVSRWACDPDELVLLEAAAGVADEIVALRVALAHGSVLVPGSRGQDRLNPAVTALVEHRRVLRYLLAGMRVPAREHAESSATSNAGRGLAAARWEKGGRRGA